MQSELRINFVEEMKRLTDGLKVVIDSGANLASIWFDLQLVKIEAEQKQAALILAKLSSTDDDPDDDVLNTDEAAVLLKMPKQTLYWKAAKGEIPHGRAGRRYKFSRKDLLAYLQSEAVKAQAKRTEKQKNTFPKLRKVA